METNPQKGFSERYKKKPRDESGQKMVARNKKVVAVSFKSR
jgi:hypothetical protein